MSDIQELVAPQLGVNEDRMLLVWLVKDQAEVAKAESICALETMKVYFEVEAPSAGFLVQLVENETEVLASTPIGLLGKDLEALQQERERRARLAASPQGDASGPVATRKARMLADELGVDLAAIVQDGIIREKDVRAAAGKGQEKRMEPSELTWRSGTIPVAVYGMSHGRSTLAECLTLLPGYAPVCFIDDATPTPSRYEGLPVFHSSRLPDVAKAGVVTSATNISGGRIRRNILRRCKEVGISMPPVVHPRAWVSPSATLGEGTYVKAGAVIDTNAQVGVCCIVDNNATVAHDCVLGDGSHLAPGASLGGGVRVGVDAVVGVGASVASDVSLGDRTIITMGSSVTSNIAADHVLEGVPGKPIGTRR